MKNDNYYLYTEKRVKLKPDTVVIDDHLKAIDYANHKRSYVFRVFDARGNWIAYGIPK